jgi:outer membrane murein-binding lipoprotein Lpp
LRKAVILCSKAGYSVKPNKHMELLVLFIIGLLIAIIVLPFVALAKANSAKRGVDDLAARLESLENEVHSLRQHTVTAPKFEAAVIAVEAMPSPLPIATPIPIVQERKSEPPPIPERFTKEAVPRIATPPKPPINW